MSKTDPGLEPRLSRSPTYQAALRGQWFAPGMPQTPGFRDQHLRAAARADGVDIPSGYAFKDGRFQDANEDHWYSDPRVIGPIAVGASTLGMGLLGGGAGAAGGASGATTGATGTAGAGAAGGAATAPLGGVTAAAGGAGAAAGGSALDKLRNSLTSPNGIAQLASLIPMLSMATGGGGNGNGSGSGSGELDRIRAITEARMRRADPLHQVATQLAFGRAPVSARQGVTLNNVRLPE